jgi:hypothetical protein
MKTATALLLALLVIASTMPAWNATGHKIISAMVYDRLTPAARARVDDLIRAHPDYQSHFLRDVPADATPAAKARAAFINASLWPDQIRDDPRFYNDDRADAKPTPTLPGFPDMGRHVTWHYISIPFTQDGTPLRDAPTPNAVTEITRLSNVVGTPGDGAVYALPWLIHLVEDLHNPLHAVARFSQDNLNGDRGGNLIFVEPGRNLHAFWDALGGADPQTDAYINEQANLLNRTGTKRPLSVGPFAWAQEGVKEAKKSVYSFGRSSGTVEHPVQLPQKYLTKAKQLYPEEFAAAAGRLATILNGELTK